MKIERLISSTILMLLVSTTTSIATNAPNRLFAQFETPPETIPLSKIEQVKQQYEQCLLGINGVTGVGIGKDATNKDVIIVYLHDASVQKYIPKKLDSFAVQTIVTGVIRPLER